MTRTALRIGGAIGIAHVAIVIAGFAIEFGDGIDVTLNAPKENLTALFVRADPGPIFFGGHLELLGYLLLLPFAAALYRRLRAAESAGSFGATTSVLAVVAFVATTLSLPGGSGLTAIPRIATACPDAAVRVLTMLEDDNSLTAALRAGARGYLVKGVGQEELLAALRTVVAGGAVFAGAVADRVRTGLTGSPRHR
jgi:CheY-like chemotaxis protein